MSNYVQDVTADLAQRLPSCPPDLLEMYAQLVLTTGVITTLEDVHQAWSVWRNRTDPTHRSLVPFADLAPEVQELDRPYADAIRQVAAGLALAR